MYDDENGKWSPRGRRVEKAFLYDIVANENDSCDVDKFDYLIRDSLSAGIPIPFNKRSIERLMENARVLLDPGHGFPRICYAKKIANSTLPEMAEAQNILKDIEERNLPVKLDEVQCGSSWVDEIANSTLPEMAEAQNILKDIEERNLPVKLDEVQCGSSWVDERLIRQRIQDELGENIDDEEFMVLVRAMHRGLDGRSHPMSRVLLYDNKTKDISVAYTDKKWLQLKTPEEAAIWTIRLYVARSMAEADRSQVAKAFDKIVTSIGLRQTVDSALAG
nr:SAM domain and HD domain-containing protein [Haemonchus contortus]